MTRPLILSAADGHHGDDLLFAAMAATRMPMVVTDPYRPDDPRDQNTPNPPQPKDEFVLKFVKPAS